MDWEAGGQGRACHQRLDDRLGWAGAKDGSPRREKPGRGDSKRRAQRSEIDPFQPKLLFQPSAPLTPTKKTKNPGKLDRRREIDELSLQHGRGVAQPLDRPPVVSLHREGGADDRPDAHPHDEVRKQSLLTQGAEDPDVGGASCRPSSQDQREERGPSGEPSNHPTDSSIHAR
jgi:hypothetical protein